MVPKINNILYASDLSDNSMPALAWAMMLASRHDARISFLHVIEEASSGMTYTIRSFMGDEKWNELMQEQHGEVNAKVTERIQRFCDRVGSDLQACSITANDIIIKRGIPVEEILKEADSRGHDVIVMGTHGAGLFKDAMIGGTARRVLRRSKIPVFVIPLETK